MSSAAPAEASARLSGALHAVGAVLGIEVTTTDRDEWELDERGLRVGLGWYLQRGHGGHEAVALAALQLWEGPRDALRAPARARRVRALERARPELSPLIGAVRRAQAVAELLLGMPGLRIPLQSALQRSLPSELATLPRHLQWATLVVGSQTTSPEKFSVEDPAVAGEWLRIRALGSEGADALRHVLVPDRKLAPLRRFERALALLLPAYERLLALDISEHSPTVLRGSDRAELTVHAEQPLGSDDFASNDDLSNDPEQPESQPEKNPESAPRAADLFAVEHQSFAATILSTPIPDASSIFDATIQLAEQAVQYRPERSDTGDAAGNGDQAAATRLAEYRSRTEQLAGPIDAMRALWAQIIAERVAPRRSRSRVPQAEGDELATEALAEIVANTVAGVRKPDAFLACVVTPRLTRSAGSTDYVLMVDRSASMRGPAAEAAADAALIMIEALAAAERDILHAERAAGIDLELDIRTSLIVFDAEAVVLKPLSRGLDDRVRRLMHGEVRSPSGATNDAAALRAAGAQLGVLDAGSSRREGARRRRIAILVSDGGSNDQVSAEREKRKLQAAGVTVYGIGLGSPDIVARYAPHGVSIDDSRKLPKEIARVIEFELG